MGAKRWRKDKKAPGGDQDIERVVPWALVMGPFTLVGFVLWALYMVARAGGKSLGMI